MLVYWTRLEFYNRWADVDQTKRFTMAIPFLQTLVQAINLTCNVCNYMSHQNIYRACPR